MDRVIAFAATECSRDYAAACVAAIEAARTAFQEAEERLGRLDAVAGDGDHGRGMVRGIDASYVAATAAPDQGAGAGDGRALHGPTKPAERPVSSGAPGSAPSVNPWGPTPRRRGGSGHRCDRVRRPRHSAEESRK
jgi:dihydroxyacetone kinase